MKKYYSQFEQDRVIYERYFKKKKNGFFLEIGADDGVDKSNTKFFEDLGWKGICIEPSPERFKYLNENRNCICINKAIGKERSTVEFIDIVGYGKGLSGIVNNYKKEHLERIEKETKNNTKTVSKKNIKVETIPLSDILKEYNISQVDYCSIDVEGSELEVLKSIDFTNCNITVFSIEDPYDNKLLKEYIISKGYIIANRLGPDIICKKETSLFDKIFGKH